MRKLAIYVTIFFCFLILTACNQAGSSQELIKPGDKLDDFLVTTGVEGNFTYGFEVECAEPKEKNTYACTAAVGEAVNVSTGLYDDTGSGKLDEVWRHSNYKMYINDRPVDLSAFGTIDYVHPTMGAIRFGNVIIIASAPGEVTVRDEGVFDNGDPFASTTTYTFTAP